MTRNEPQFLYGIFVNLLTKTFASGVSRFLIGHYPVIIQEIPEDQLTDWHLGPKIVPGWWGAYRGVSMHSGFPLHGFNHHGPYPYATAESLAKIEIEAAKDFRYQLGEYSRCNSLKSLEATMRYRGYNPEDFDDSLCPPS